MSLISQNVFLGLQTYLTMSCMSLNSQDAIFNLIYFLLLEIFIFYFKFNKFSYLIFIENKQIILINLYNAKRMQNINR